MHTITSTTQAHPFAMLLDLDQVLRSMESSERLNHLQRHVYRPLDKPLIAGRAASADFDRLVDAAAEDEEGGEGGDSAS